ncbi:uncharacterized protein DUF4446 [Natranaerovirga hydrolytica]|uniref:Uncharacterized protein DUF4446 n=1 Tax=Natranaerovirga hydrolytica TaxID=680378 RepID=A0A4R1M7E7_9FIRM|nr:DUF4446 family protein [Natranaerovirga hydrolytica]TCK86774.1 uncharacterized protein DUF4446 [Natranaerovirga hydrolytica]
MDIFDFYIRYYERYILFAIPILLLLFIILNIIQQVRVSKLKKKYNFFMKNGEKDIEKLLVDQMNQIEKINHAVEGLENKHIAMDETIKETFQHIGIVKYNAFKEMSGDTSFALSLLTSKKDGFIINVIHSREGSYTYLKKIEEGKSMIQLSKEEEEALNQSMKNN